MHFRRTTSRPDTFVTYSVLRRCTNNIFSFRRMIAMKFEFVPCAKGSGVCRKCREIKRTGRRQALGEVPVRVQAGA